MVFPRFVTETTPMLGPGCSGWTIPLAWWLVVGEIWAPQNAILELVKQLEKPPKRLTCRIQGRGESHWWSPDRELLKMLVRIAGSVAGGSVVPRVAAFGRNRWRSFGCHSADWLRERCPFLAQKWDPFFVKILCQGYVSQFLEIPSPSIS